MFRASTAPIIRSYQLYTWQLICFMQVMWLLPRRVRFQPDSPRQRPHNLHETYQLPRVQQLITRDDGRRRCPKHVEFSDKIKFWIFDTSCWSFILRSSDCVERCSHCMQQSHGFAARAEPYRRLIDVLLSNGPILQVVKG